MKASLDLSLRQGLAMTPQLQQSIRLLQLSSLDLHQEIRSLLETNPLLEEVTPCESRAQIEHDLEQAGRTTAPEPVAEANITTADMQTPDSQDDWSHAIAQELPVDSGWDDSYGAHAGQSASGTAPDCASFTEAADSLHSHLHWQVDMMALSDTERLVALALIDAIDDNGYLSLPLEEMEASLPGVDRRSVEKVLQTIQRLDPAGVGGRDLRECLLIQLDQLPDSPDTRDDRNTLARLIDNHIELLGQHDYARLQRKLGISQDQLKRALGLLRSLSPRPGCRFQSVRAHSLIPDIIATKSRDGWRVELNPEAAPRVRVNPEYEAMVAERRANRDASGGLADQLREARGLVNSLGNRYDTLLIVARRIIEFQHDFMEEGPQAMRPLLLQDIAEATGLHESTVSRATTRKFICTPGGTFELKYFFSSQVSTSSGEGCSSTAVRALISQLIKEEDPASPLSDSQLVTLLAEQGIKVARRTLAKYRESLAIQPSHQRRRSAQGALSARRF